MAAVPSLSGLRRAAPYASARDPSATQSRRAMAPASLGGGAESSTSRVALDALTAVAQAALPLARHAHRLLPLGLWLAMSLAAGPAVHAAGAKVAILGDTGRVAFLRALATAVGAQPRVANGVFQLDDPASGLRFVVPAEKATLVEIADVAAAADLVLLAVDSTVGPMPVTREHVLVARQAMTPAVGVMLTRTDAPGVDQELLELLELETRELLKMYGFDGAGATVFRDTPHASAGQAPPGRGMAGLLRSLALNKTRRAVTASAPAVADFEAVVYLLTTQEASVARPVIQ